MHVLPRCWKQWTGALLLIIGLSWTASPRQACAWQESEEIPAVPEQPAIPPLQDDGPVNSPVNSSDNSPDNAHVDGGQDEEPGPQLAAPRAILQRAVVQPLSPPSVLARPIDPEAKPLQPEAIESLPAESTAAAKSFQPPAAPEKWLDDARHMADKLIGGVARRQHPTPEGAAFSETSAGGGDTSVRAPQFVEVRAAGFNGVQPGTSRVADVKRAWGEPTQVARQGESIAFIYLVKPFKRVEIKLVGEIVRAITIDLGSPIPPERLAGQLKLQNIRAVEVPDEEGHLLGRAFPERGVLFCYASGKRELEVAQIVLEPIDAPPFVLRAENRLHGPYRENLADLDYAIKLDPKYAYPHWLRAQVLLAVGRVEEAASSAKMAVQLEPSRPEFRLTWGQCLAQQGDYAEAIEQSKKALLDEKTPPVVKAKGLSQLGDLVAMGPTADYKQAIRFHQAAIKLADPLAVDPRVSVRRAAKETLIEAHLGVARDIGWGYWQRKPEVVPRWIERAGAFAEEMILNEVGGRELRLRIAESALAAHAGFQPAIDPAEWIREAQKVSDVLVAASDDPLWQQSIGWQLGQAYGYALQIEHARGNFEQGLKYGTLAQQYLEAGAASRETSPRARERLGELYFKIGALHAVHRQDYETAIAWYDKAVSVLAPETAGGLSDPGRLGETLVVMGVSYWEADLRQKAVELTRTGVKMIKLAVERGEAEKSALAVPYQNLARMHREQGDDRQAKGFAELADWSQDIK